MTAPKKYPFLIRIGARANPRLEYGVMCESWFAAWSLAQEDAEMDERIDVIPIGERESFAVKVERLALQAAQLRECLA